MSSDRSNRSNRRSSTAIALVLSVSLCHGCLGSSSASEAAEDPAAPATVQGSAAVAELQEWDQEAVAKIAEKLVAALKDLRVSVDQADRLADAGARASKYRARQDLRLLTTAANSLASDLKAGEGREATLPAYRRMQTLRRDAAENGRRGMILADTLAKIAAAKELLDELAPYYGE